MKLIEFKEQNVIFAENQPEYLPLPAHVVRGDKEGQVVCCWELSWKERFKVLFSGLIWHSVLTFGRPLQPQMLDIEKPDMKGGATTRVDINSNGNDVVLADIDQLDRLADLAGVERVVR